MDWLLGTPVDRGRLLRPRFRVSAALATVAGAAVGVVPAAALVSLGLGGGGTGGHVLRLAAAAMVSAALLFAPAAGAAGLIERYPASWRWLRRATPAALAVRGVRRPGGLGGARPPPGVLTAMRCGPGPGAGPRRT